MSNISIEGSGGGGGGTLTVGVTPISDGAANQLLYDNGGTLEETSSPLVVSGGSGLSFTGPNITNTTGSDLVTDGNLATDPTLSGWVLNDNTWSAGQISGTLSNVYTGDVAITIPITVASNTWYVVELHVTMVGGDGPAVYFDGDGVGGHGISVSGAGSPIPPPTGPQVYKFPVFASASGANHLTVDFNFYLYNGSSWVVTFISMKPMAAPLPSPQLTITNFAGDSVFDSAGLEFLQYIRLGDGALQETTTGTGIGIGVLAGASLTTETRNIAIGNNSMSLASGGSFNVGIGDFSLLTNQGGFNSAIGSEALYSNTTGTHNQAFGPNVLYACTSGSYNHGFGEHAGLNLTTGSHNVMIGYGAGGSTLTTGSDNILIGDQVDTPTGSTSNYLNIGGVITGNMSAGPLAITTGSLNFKFPASNGTNTYVLQTDGSGNTSWTAPGGGITIGTTTITSGTNLRFLYDNSGIVGETSGVTFPATGTVDVTVAYTYQSADAIIGSPANGNWFFAQSGNITLSSAQFNLGFGDLSLSSVTTCLGNTGMGAGSLQNITSGNNNVAVGGGAIQRAAGGAHDNVGIGANCLQHGTGTLVNNVAIGSNCMFTCSSGIQNNAIGSASLYALSSGQNNVAVGNFCAGTNIVTGSNNVAIGANIDYGSDVSGCIIIGTGDGVLHVDYNLTVANAWTFDEPVYTTGAAQILGSKTTITGGATGNVPTLTAGPVTGNPTKWLPYNDNGTTRYIPSW